MDTVHPLSGLPSLGDCDSLKEQRTVALLADAVRPVHRMAANVDHVDVWPPPQSICDRALGSKKDWASARRFWLIASNQASATCTGDL